MQEVVGLTPLIAKRISTNDHQIATQQHRHNN